MGFVQDESLRDTGLRQGEPWRNTDLTPWRKRCVTPWRNACTQRKKYYVLLTNKGPFGSEDFALDLGLPTKREGEAADLLYARSATVVAAVSAGKLAFDGIWPDIKDAAGLRADALRARRLGFAGKTLIHPDQIAVVNEIFSPTAEEVEEARRVVHAFDQAVARGDGAVALDGRMLDAPVVDRARRVLRALERNS